MKRVLTIGGAMHDIFIEYEDASVLHMHTKGQQSFIMLEEGRKIEVNTIFDFVGGGAANVAVSFKRLGLETAAFFKIGDDSPGQLIMNSLSEQNINLDFVVKTEHEKTGTSFIIPCGSGDKVALVYRGANLTIESTDIDPQAFSNRDLVYITSLSKNAAHSLIDITAQAKKNNAMVAVNPGGSQLSAGLSTLCQSLKNIDIFILNAQEAQEFMTCLLQSEPKLGQELKKNNAHSQSQELPHLLQKALSFDNHCFTFTHYFQEILKRGPKIAVVTNGAEGVYIATEKTLYFYPSPEVNVVSTLGAGDAFGSCFTGMLTLGKPIEEALIAGIYNSCSVISHLGTQTGLLEKDDLESEVKKADKSLLQKFPL